MGLKTETENIISSGVDEANRRIFFGRYMPNAGEDLAVTDFNPTSVEYAVRGILTLQSINPKKAIEIHMNSYGGNPHSMLYLHDLILASPCQFKFFGGGAIMSSATWIMAVCDERYLYKNTSIVVHKGDLSFDGTMTDVEISFDEERRLQYKLEEIYAHNSHMPKKFWSEVCKRDLHLTADETVFLGLADKVIEPKKRGNLRRMRQAHMLKVPSANTLKKVVSRLYNRIQFPINIKDITINDPIIEKIDPTLTVEEPKGELNGEPNTGTSSGDISSSNGTDGSSSPVGS